MIEIALENTLAAETFGSGSRTIDSREYLVDTLEWVAEPTVPRHDFLTPDLTPLLQELLGDDDVDPSDAFVFRFTGSGRRDAASFDGNRHEPELVIEYADGGHTSLDADLFGLV